MMLIWAIGHAQHPDLIPNNWYIQMVTIDGVDYFRPYPNFNGEAIFTASNFDVWHWTCSEGFGTTINYVDQDEFSIADTSVILIGTCGLPSENIFMQRHYDLYIVDNLWARNPFTYTITPGPNGNTLVVTNGDGDVGVYGDVLLSSSDHTMDVISIYPNPARDEVFISGLTERMSYSLFTILGVQVSKGIVGNNEPITTGDLQSGIYILQLEDGRTGRVVVE